MGPTESFEQEARQCGYAFVAGLDEAGRGPLAGPVVAAAVMLPCRFKLAGLDDSKRVSAADRERLAKVIRRRATGIGIGVASVPEIDALNILRATRLAMVRALQELKPSPDFLLLDAVTLPAVPLPQRPVIKGDCLCVSIAAASIIAKVTRDRLMQEYHRQYPSYHFHVHKGYATPAHLSLLDQFGPCEIHRRSFRPVACCNEADEDTLMAWEEDMGKEAHTFGKLAESDAERYLRSKGYRILDRNVRSSIGELDLVAKTGDVLVFVEVKARSTRAYGGAIHAVDARKQARLVRLAARYLAAHRLRNPPCRFDVILCTGGAGKASGIEHIEGAFEVPGDDLRW